MILIVYEEFQYTIAKEEVTEYIFFLLVGVKRRHTMSLSGEDYHQLSLNSAAAVASISKPNSNSYPSENSPCSKHPSSSSNETFTKSVRSAQVQRQERITSVCDKCRVSGDSTKDTGTRVADAAFTHGGTWKSAGTRGGDADPLQPHCGQLTEIKLKRQMLNHILVDDVHKVRKIQFWSYLVRYKLHNHKSLTWALTQLGKLAVECKIKEVWAIPQISPLQIPSHSIRSHTCLSR